MYDTYVKRFGQRSTESREWKPFQRNCAPKSPCCLRGIFRNVYLRIFIFLLLETSDSGDGDNSYFGHNKTVFVVVMCLVSILALTAIAVCAICMKKKNINIFILLQNIGTSSNENVPPGSNSTTRSSKRPAHNQVMDLHSVATTSRSTCVPQMAV
jgi:hypothetical protein